MRDVPAFIGSKIAFSDNLISSQITEFPVYERQPKNGWYENRYFLTISLVANRIQRIRI